MCLLFNVFRLSKNTGDFEKHMNELFNYNKTLYYEIMDVVSTQSKMIETNGPALNNLRAYCESAKKNKRINDMETALSSEPNQKRMRIENAEDGINGKEEEYHKSMAIPEKSIAILSEKQPFNSIEIPEKEQKGIVSVTEEEEKEKEEIKVLIHRTFSPPPLIAGNDSQFARLWKEGFPMNKVLLSLIHSQFRIA
jgi:hypothetical protein